MSDQFVAEIRIFGFNFPPTGWAFCDGEIMSIYQNTALFSLLGTTYGGDGKSNFCLPNLQGRAPMMWGQGPGLSLYDIGEIGGSETVTLLESEIPYHTHTLRAIPNEADHPSPTDYSLGRPVSLLYQTNTSEGLVDMASQSLPPAGGDMPHNNMQPYLTLNFCIALVGIFPQRP